MAAPLVRPWIIRDERMLISRPPFIEVSVQTVELPSGRVIPDYYQIRMADFVCVYAQTSSGGVLVLRSYRHGPRRVCLNFPGGRINDGEDPLVAARRELREETGYEGARWQHLGSFVTQGNQRAQTAHLYRALDCRPVAAANSGDLEDAVLLEMTQAEVGAAVRGGEFASLDHVALFGLAATAPAQPRAG